MRDNDEISSNIGPGANGVAAGKEINQAVNTTNVASGGLDTILNHLIIMRGELSVIKEDVRLAYVERAGMIEIVNGLIERVDAIRAGIYPRWLRWLMVGMATLAIFIATLSWVTANSGLDINWLALGIYAYIVASTITHLVTLMFVYRQWTIIKGSLSEAVDRLVDDRIHGTVTELEKRIENAKYQNVRQGDGVDGS